MWDFLRDPIWQFIGAILALGAIFISITLYLRQRRRKALFYEIVSRTPLLSMEEEVKGKLKILFEEKLVQQVHLIVVRFVNSGNMSILATDYERPVSLSFGEKAQILTVEVTETNPDSLQASAKIEGDKVVLAPTLLNAKDMITLKILVSRFAGQTEVDGRIVGVKDIQKSTVDVRSLVIQLVTAFVMITIGSIGWAIVEVGSPLFWIFLGFFVSGYFLVTAGLLRFPRFRERLRKALHRKIVIFLED